MLISKADCRISGHADFFWFEKSLTHEAALLAIILEFSSEFETPQSR